MAAGAVRTSMAGGWFLHGRLTALVEPAVQKGPERSRGGEKGNGMRYRLFRMVSQRFCVFVLFFRDGPSTSGHSETLVQDGHPCENPPPCP
jgi:hypothetical protein